MKTNYIIGQPVDIRTYKGFGSLDKLIEGKIAEYNGYGQTIKTYAWEGTTPSSLTWNSGSVQSTEFKLKNEFLYDAYDNVVQSTTEGVQMTSIIWGYNGTIPVIKAENASYQTLITAVGSALSSVGYGSLETLMSSLGDITNNTSQQTLWRNFNTALRNNALLKNSLITSFTHSPLIGVTSQTDSKGMATYYQYDSFNRLAQVVDNNNNIIRQSTYHYYNQSALQVFYNTEQAQVFTRNDCSYGSQVVYIVPANTYFSDISLADANAKALADINANGQNYANANGICNSQATLTIDLDPGTTTSDIGDFCSVTVRDSGNGSIIYSGYACQWILPFSVPISSSSNGAYEVTIVPAGMYPLEVNINYDLRDIYTSQTWYGVSGNTISINIKALF